MIEFYLFDNKGNLNQQQCPIEQENFKTQNKSQQQQLQTLSSSISSQQLEKLNYQNFSYFINNQVQNVNQNFQQITDEPNYIQYKTKQSEDFQNQQHFNTFNKSPPNKNYQKQPQKNTIIPLSLLSTDQFQQNPFQFQQSQLIYQQQPFKQQEFQQQFKEKQQNQNQFSNSDSFIINEMKQIRESETTSNNYIQQEELRKTQNITRIQQQFPPAHNFQMKVQQNPEQQMQQEQDENKELEQQSLKLAQKLQSEFDQENLDNINYDFTKDCDICFVKLDLEEMMVLDCGHIFHLNCLNQTCLTQMQSRQFPIYCPNQYCKKPIIYNDLAQILDKINLELYQQLTFQSYIDSHGDEYSWCPTPDCQFVFIQEGNNHHFLCPVCSKQYCLNCKAEFHNGQTCQQYMAYQNMNKEDQQFYQFVQGAKFKQCPKCKFWVDKNRGCNHMTCRCKFHFCYTCGQDYKQQCKCKDNYHLRRNPRFQNIQI